MEIKSARQVSDYAKRAQFLFSILQFNTANIMLDVIIKLYMIKLSELQSYKKIERIFCYDFRTAFNNIYVQYVQ